MITLTNAEGDALWSYIQDLRDRVRDLAYGQDVAYVSRSKAVSRALDKLVHRDSKLPLKSKKVQKH